MSVKVREVLNEDGMTLGHAFVVAEEGVGFAAGPVLARDDALAFGLWLMEKHDGLSLCDLLGAMTAHRLMELAGEWRKETN